MTVAAHLTGYVTLRDADRKVHTFGPGDDVPAWARQRITNPSAWSGEQEAPAPPPAPTVPPAATPAVEGDQGSDEGDEDDDGAEVPPAVVAGDEPPPRGGRGSGAPAWRAYAAAHGVEVADDASREDVIEACDAASVPTD